MKEVIFTIAYGGQWGTSFDEIGFVADEIQELTVCKPTWKGATCAECETSGTVSVCGNGEAECGEECDDGNDF